MSHTAYDFYEVSTELQRLILQAQILKPTTERLLREAGVRPGMRVLDVGCGAGDVSLLAAEIVGASGSVVGIDQSPEAIAKARERIREAGHPNIEFSLSSVGEFASDDMFDVLIGRYVLIHQPEPSVFIRAARRHVRPGGVVAFHEIDHRRGLLHCLPANPVCDDVAEWLKISISEMLPGRDAAGRMVQHFLNAGLPCPKLFAVIPVGGGEESKLYAWMADAVRTVMPRLLKRGITEAQISIDSLEERMRASCVEAQSQVEIAEQVCAWVRI